MALGEDKVLTPAAVAYQYHEQFILGPALIIVLAAMTALLLKFPASKGKIGAVMAMVGCAEVLVTLPISFLWGFLIGLITLVIGLTIGATSIASMVEDPSSRAKLSAALLLIGFAAISLAVPTVSFWVLLFGLIALIGGGTMGIVYLASRLKKPSLTAEIGVVLVAVGIAEILALWSVIFVWNFIIGLTMSAIGITLCATALKPWIKMRLTQRNIRVLRQVIYAVLAIVIALSGLLIYVRTSTNIIHEQWLQNYYGSNSPNLKLRGVITGIALNHEVNTGYSYHIFPAYITMNVTEFVWGSEIWQNQTSAAQYWVGQTAVIYYEKTDVPSLASGQSVEVSGYYCMPLEDSLYSGKIVVAAGMSEGYINPR